MEGGGAPQPETQARPLSSLGQRSKKKKKKKKQRADSAMAYTNEDNYAATVGRIATGYNDLNMSKQFSDFDTTTQGGIHEVDDVAYRTDVV